MRKFRIISGTTWSLLFIYLGYVSYDVHGDRGLFYYFIFMALCFPSSVGLQFFLRATGFPDMFLGGGGTQICHGRCSHISFRSRWLFPVVHFSAMDDNESKKTWKLIEGYNAVTSKEKLLLSFSNRCPKDHL